MLDLFVDHAHPRTISRMLFDQLRDAVASGRLAPGDRLPTSRDLAVGLGVARSTVTGVYGRLVAEGVLEARVGDGTFVAAPAVGEALRRSARHVHDVLAVRRTAPRPAAPAPVGPGDIDLRTGRPDPALFPTADWRRCITEALHEAPPGYGDPAGLPRLRQAIAAWISRSRSVTATAGQVLVTSGAQQAVDLVARCLLAPGDTVAIEDPGYPAARLAFESHGMRVVPVPVDRHGIVVDAIPPSARAVYVTPSHQSPTGVTLSAVRRHALLAVAASRGMAIVEDDYDTELRWVDRPLEPLHRLDTAGRVLYVGTFSKTLSPSLRLGFVVAPDAIVDEMAAARKLVDAQPPHLTQAALAELLTSGRFERHLRRMRRALRPRHDLVVDAVAQMHHVGAIAEPWTSNAGLHAMIELLPGTDAAEVARRLARRGVVIDTTDAWWAGAPRPGLLVGFGLAGPDALRHALDLVHHEVASLALR